MARELEIFYTSDTHGHIFPVDYATGEKERSGLLAMEKQVKKTGNTLVLDGGDVLQGTPLLRYYLEHPDRSCPHPAAEVLNALGCDYFTLGNHDFNFGYEAIADYLAAMDAVCLCANVRDRTGRLPIKKETVHTLGNGLRVGICGCVTDFINIWEREEHLENFEITDPFEAAKESCERLRGNCDITVCLYHGGFEEDLATGKVLSSSGENIACRMARELPFDILLTGHQHLPVAGIDLSGTWAVQPPYGAAAYVHLTAEEKDAAAGGEGSGTPAFFITSSLEEVGEEVDETLAEKLMPLEEKAREWLDIPLGRLAEAIPPEEKLPAALHGSRLAALFNQVQLDATGADLSCTSLSNSALSLGPEVSMRDVCAVYPFANTIRVLEVDESVLRACLERSAAYFTLADGEVSVSEEFLKPKVAHYNYDFFAGISYAFDLTRPVGQRVVSLALLDGSPLGNRTYQMAMSDYRSSGTGGYSVLTGCRVVYSGDTEVPDLLADYIETHSPVPDCRNYEITVYGENGAVL